MLPDISASTINRSSRTPFVILGLLGLSGREARSGYEMKKAIDSVVSHFWSESNGQIYPALRQLESNGLIRARQERTKGRRKTLYAITAKGSRRLRSWLEAPVELGKPRDELILKLFFGSKAGVPALLRHLEAHRDRTKAALEQCHYWQREIAENPTPYSPFMLITLRAGIAVSEASRRWAEESIETLAAMKGARNSP